MDFNPSKQCLRIEESARPNHYELLQFAVIANHEAAYSDRHAMVQCDENSTYRTHAVHTNSQLSAVGHCLTDRTRKLEFDNRKDLAAHQPWIEDAELLKAERDDVLPAFDEDGLGAF